MYEAELIVYDEDGNNFTISLTDLQSMAVFKAIGFTNFHDGTYGTFSHETMQKVLSGKINPFTARLVEVDS